MILNTFAVRRRVFEGQFNCMLSCTGCWWDMRESFPCGREVLSLCRNCSLSHQFAKCSGNDLIWHSWSLSLLTHFPPILFRLLLVCFLPHYSFLLFFNSFPQPANQNLKLKLMKLKCPSQFLDLFSLSLFSSLDDHLRFGFYMQLLW